VIEEPVPIAQGDIWFALLDPVVGHEQRGRKPVLVISNDNFHAIPSSLAIVVPITSRFRGIPAYVPVQMREGQLTRESFAISDQPRTIGRRRLRRRVGRADHRTLGEVLLYIRRFLDAY
jgi:mRNA interferase MazF